MEMKSVLAIGNQITQETTWEKPPPCELQTSDPETDETESVYDHNQVTTETTWDNLAIVA